MLVRREADELEHSQTFISLTHIESLRNAQNLMFLLGLTRFDDSVKEYLG